MITLALPHSPHKVALNLYLWIIKDYAHVRDWHSDWCVFSPWLDLVFFCPWHSVQDMVQSQCSVKTWIVDRPSTMKKKRGFSPKALGNDGGAEKLGLRWAGKIRERELPWISHANHFTFFYAFKPYSHSMRYIYLFHKWRNRLGEIRQLAWGHKAGSWQRLFKSRLSDSWASYPLPSCAVSMSSPWCQFLIGDQFPWPWSVSPSSSKLMI